MPDEKNAKLRNHDYQMMACKQKVCPHIHLQLRLTVDVHEKSTTQNLVILQ